MNKKNKRLTAVLKLSEIIARISQNFPSLNSLKFSKLNDKY